MILKFERFNNQYYKNGNVWLCENGLENFFGCCLDSKSIELSIRTKIPKRRGFRRVTIHDSGNLRTENGREIKTANTCSMYRALGLPIGTRIWVSLTKGRMA